jgi:hypothetical protein
MSDLIKSENIISQIYYIRGVKVMLDFHLADLYDVETRVLNQAVQRNIERFPEDFMFQLSDNEIKNLTSQIVTSSWGGRRRAPYAFTEQGVAMLSGVLRSEKAINVNIAIMRAFVRMRELISQNKELKKKLDKMESKYDQQFKVVFNAIRQLIEKKNEPRNIIGFKTGRK